VIPT
jgi:hypothetical protein